MKSAFIAGLIILAWITSAVSAALVPAVNSPMLSMSGGTVPSVLYSSTSVQTINTTTETSLFSGTFGGPGRTITQVSSGPNIAPYPNERFHMRAAGQFTNGETFTGTGTFNLYFGANTIGSGAIITRNNLAVPVGNVPFTTDFYCSVVLLNGASSPVICDGIVTINGNTTPLVATGVFNAAADFTLNMTFSFSTVTGGPSLSVLSSVVENLF